VSSANHRAKQTVRNLVFSLLVTLGLTVAIVMAVPRDDSNRIQKIDYVSIAAETQQSLGLEVLAPAIPTEWWSNGARLETTLGVETWYVGFVTQDNQYIGLTQAFESNPSWLANQLQGNWQDGSMEIEGRTWEIWPTLRPTVPAGTKEYALVHNYETSSVVIYGTADEAQFRLLATAISKELNQGD
jgi:hypothetical protein